MGDPGFNEFTFSPSRRPSLNPARAPAVWVVLLQLEAELLLSAERQPEQQLAVFQIDAGDKCPRLLWMAARILRLGSAEREREDCASGPPVAAFAVAEFAVVAAADAAEFAAAASAVATVDAVAVVFAAEAAAAAVAAGIAVALVVAAIAAAVAFVVAVAVRARRQAGKTSLAAECY